MNRRRIIPLLVLAAAALVAAARWNAGGAPQTAAPAASILERRIASIHLHGVPAKKAFEKVQEQAGIKLRPNWPALAARDVLSGNEIWLDLDDVPLGQVMQALTVQLRDYRAAAGFETQGDSILIAPDADLPHTVRIYDVRDLLKEASTIPPSNEIATAISFQLEPRFWECGVVVSAQKKWLHEQAGRLIVLQSSVVHRQIAELLNALRLAQADGSGPAIGSARVDYKRSFLVTECCYDVRDLAPRAEFTVPPVMRDGQVQRASYLLSGAAALAGLLEDAARARSFGFSRNTGRICAACGRLVVEQTGENQKKVRDLLRDLRSGTRKVPGFRVKPAGGSGAGRP
jgi:hypothetical protein